MPTDLERENAELRRELEKTRLKLAERGLVERAKGMLMKSYGLDEDAAYHWLRRLAMEANKRIGEIAQHVIDGRLA